MTHQIGSCKLFSSTLIKKPGFTLAEVLITLGIIGVVAALTMPSLVSHYKKLVIETKLQKFYSLMQQAVKLSEIENGDKKEWAINGDIEEYYNKYYSKYLNGARFEKTGNYSGRIYFSDGTALTISAVDNSTALNPTNADFIHGSFYPYAQDMFNERNKTGKNSFLFMWGPNVTSKTEYCEAPFLNNYNKGWEPYLFWENRHWDTTKNCAQIDVPDNDEEYIDVLINQNSYGCGKGGAYCTELIRHNGWKIPDDYPIKL